MKRLLLRHSLGHRRAVALCNANIHYDGLPRLNLSHGLGQRPGQGTRGFNRAIGNRPLGARNCGDVNVGLSDGLPDMLVLDGSIPDPCHAFLMHLVIEIGSVVGHHDQQRHAVMGRCPKRGSSHQKVAIAKHRNR